jgi:hypothetical protein
VRILRGGLAALLLFAPFGARAQDAAAARAFVRHLYAAYHGDGPDYLGRQAGAVFAKPLLQLIRRDAAETPPGDVGALDGDPICGCQDFDGLRDLDVVIARGDAGHAHATVHFRISGERRTVNLDLVAADGHWRVSDVHTADTPSLVSLLTRSLSGAHPKE